MKNPRSFALIIGVALALTALYGAASATGTTLEVGGVSQNSAITIEASLASGTTAILKDKNGTTVDTCSASEIAGTTSTFTGTPSGAVSTLKFGSCSHTTHVLANGNLSVSWAGGTNGTVNSSGAEVTIRSTIFGVSCIAKTGAGTALGTLTGVKEGHATMHINANIDMGACGIGNWTGTYTVTTPTGLGVTS